MLNPNKLILTFEGCYLCATVGKYQSRNAIVRMRTDRQTHTQTKFFTCPMLCAIAMGQIISLLPHYVHGTVC